MRQMQKWFGIIWVIFSLGVNADQSLHKRIDLQGQAVEQVYVNGYVTVELQQSQTEFVEIFWRKDSVDQLKVGIEDNANARFLFVKSVAKSSGDSWDKTPIAHVKINLSKLTEIKAHNAHWLSVSHFSDQALALLASGDSRLIFKNLRYQNLIGQVKHTATLSISDSQIKMNQLRFYGAPKILFQRHKAEMINVGLFDHARITLDKVSAASLYLSGTYKTQTLVSKQSNIGFVALYGSVDSLMNLQNSQIKTADIRVTHNAQIKLGDLEVLTVDGANKGVVSYMGDAIVKTDLKDQARVHQNEIIKSLMSSEESVHE